MTVMLRHSVGQNKHFRRAIAGKQNVIAKAINQYKLIVHSFNMIFYIFPSKFHHMSSESFNKLQTDLDSFCLRTIAFFPQNQAGLEAKCCQKEILQSNTGTNHEI